MEISGGQRRWSGLTLLVIGGLFLLDMIFLSGDQVGSIRLISGRTSTVEIVQVGDNFLVDIDSSVYRSGERKGMALDIHFEGPDGEVIYEDSEIMSRKSRCFSFVPIEAGTYSLRVERKTVIPTFKSGTINAEFLVNDRRITRRIFGW